MTGQLKAGRRQLAYAVLLCLAGAGLGFFAATRTWAVELAGRPAPLPSVRIAQTGAVLLPWLSPLAVVGLAGAGAVLATRGAGRRLVGGLLLLVGLGVAGGGAYGLLGLARGAASPAWPVLCVVGGLLAASAGALTAVRGHSWPAMGARYERGATAPGATAGRGRDAVSAPIPAGTDGRVEGRRTTEAWDALDRGEDPTAS
jgi:uncharacterized membrane protein (TIGR02234 family)